MNLVRLISSAGTFACLTLIAMVSSAGAESGRIVGVRIAPDLANVEVQVDGQVGRHLTQTLERPNRLVIDFESAALGKLPGRIKIGRECVDEIRLGQHESRARLVIDFGENPVPRFNVLRQNQLIMVNLGKEQPAAVPAGINSAGDPAGRPSRPQISSSSSKPAEKAKSRVAVKQAGVSKDGIVMDVADRKEPKKAYRLNIDLDQNTLQVNKATLSDKSANLKQSQLPSTREIPVMTSGSLSLSGGPKKDWANSAAQPERRNQFKWGARTSEPTNPGQPQVVRRGPFKMNEYVVQRRSSAR